MPTVPEVVAIMSEKNAVVAGKRVRLDFGDEGRILLDGVAGAVTQDEGAADTTIKVSFADFLAMAAGTLNGPMAFMTGKLKVEGDMAVALQLQSVTSQIKV
jgi:putative sterol carrier protein